MSLAPTMIDTLTLDAAVTENGDFGAQVSEHPVEVGANVVDHIRPTPIQVRIDGVVSDTPATPEQVRRAAAELGVAAEPQDFTGRAANALAFLLALRDTPRLITVVTKRRTYEEMALVTLNVPTDRVTGDALRFSATFRQVRTVALRRVVLRTDPAKPGLKAKVKAATKPTATAPAELRNKTLAKRLSETGPGNQVMEFLGVR